MAKAKSIQERITSLESFPELREKLRLGWSVADVARILQEDKKELIAISRKSIEKTLLAIRTQMKPGEVVEAHLPAFVKKAAEEIESSLNEVDELWKLYSMQIKRLEMGTKNEESVGILLNTTGPEVRIAKEILDAIGKRKNDLGVRAPHQIDVNVTGQVDSGIQLQQNNTVVAVLGNSESRKKLDGLLKKLTQFPERLAHLPKDTLGPVLDVPSEEMEDGAGSK